MDGGQAKGVPALHLTGPKVPRRYGLQPVSFRRVGNGKHLGRCCPCRSASYTLK